MGSRVSDDASTALRRVDVALPRRLQTMSKHAWILRNGIVMGAATVGLFLVSRIPIVGAPLPFWIWLVAVALGWVALVAHRLRRTVKDLQEAVALVRAGEMEAVGPKLELGLARASGPFAAQLAMLLGAVEIELGRPEQGIAILDSARRSQWFEGMMHDNLGALVGAMATGWAVLGDHDAAAQALTLAHREHPATQRGLLLADDVLVHARAGRYDDVERCIAADLDAAEQILPAWSIKWIRVFQAFARAAGGAGYRTGADDRLPELFADPRVRRSMQRLASTWPELAAFLAAHGVV